MLVNMKQMLQNIRSLEMDSRGRFVDFAEIPSGKKSETIALHYLDLAAMQEMAALDPSVPVRTTIFSASCSGA